MSDTSLELGFDLGALLNGGKGGGYRRIKSEYLKEGTAFYRILPSYDQVDRRINFDYYMHWITGENSKMMKVQCTKGTEGYCPLCEASQHAEAAAKSIEQAEGKDSARFKQLDETSRALRASKAVYFNAVNASNEVVVLELNSTVVKLLTTKLEEAAGKGFDPTHPKTGVWFKFTKKGKGRDSVAVDFKKTYVTVDGEQLEKNDRTSLTDELIERLPTAVADLKNPENMYLQVFTSKELADFLRGTPLKNKFQKREPGTAAANTAQAPATNSAPVSSATLATTTTAPPVSTPTPAVMAATGSAADEVARLRNLSKGN